MLATIAYGTAFLGTIVTFVLLWWLYRHERATPPVTSESVAALVDEQYPGYAPEAVAISDDAACALLVSARDGEAMALPVGHHLVFWRLARGTLAAALAERGSDGSLTIRTGDLTRPRVAFRPGADLPAFVAQIPAQAAAHKPAQQEFAT